MPTPQSIYQIKVTLNDSKPPIWRRILVADTTTLSKLHDILQTVMGWTNSHLHHFIINEEFYGSPEDDEFGDMGTKNETRFKLNQFVNRAGFKFRYEYDFGDSWDHEIVLEKILPFEVGIKLPICLKGSRACPPEDVGGPSGYEMFLEALADPSHPEHAGILEWFGEPFDAEHFDLAEVNHLLHN